MNGDGEKAADLVADNKALRSELDCLRTSHAFHVGNLAFVTSQRDTLYGALDELRNSMNSPDDKVWRQAAYGRACRALSATTKSPPGDEIANLGMTDGSLEVPNAEINRRRSRPVECLVGRQRDDA